MEYRSELSAGSPVRAGGVILIPIVRITWYSCVAGGEGICKGGKERCSCGGGGASIVPEGLFIFEGERCRAVSFSDDYAWIKEIRELLPALPDFAAEGPLNFEKK